MLLKTCYSAKGGPTLKNYLASNISSAKVEQPCPSLCVPFLVHQGSQSGFFSSPVPNNHRTVFQFLIRFGEIDQFSISGMLVSTRLTSLVN